MSEQTGTTTPIDDSRLAVPSMAAAALIPDRGGRAGREERTFIPDRTDTIFALFAFLLGFLFMRWVFFSWQGFGVSLFTLVYSGSIVLYLRKKGIGLTPAARFWLAILLLTGFSYSLWAGNGLRPWTDLFLLLTAVYWVVSATGTSMLGKTSDWLLLDGLNALVTIPWRHFGSQFRSLASFGAKRSAATKQIVSVGLGVLLALVVALVVLPLLISADSGGFAKITAGIWQYLRWIQGGMAELLVETLLAIPTAAYLFGLVAGCARKQSQPGEGAERFVSSLRILPATTVVTTLGLLSGLYLVFIGSQLPYFFSAFAGRIPDGWQVYSEYARSGFFELCRIAAINLALLAAANLGGQRVEQKTAALKVENCLLALLTLVLIATAMSKMLLYIQAYGLSVRRILPCVFMFLLAVIYGAVAVLQRRRFSIMRLAAIVSAITLCSLSLINVDGLVARYNANRFLDGTLNSFDVEILHRAGPAGVEAALLLFDQTTDELLRVELKQYLLDQREATAIAAGRTIDTLQHALARRHLAALELQELTDTELQELVDTTQQGLTDTDAAVGQK